MGWNDECDVPPAKVSLFYQRVVMFNHKHLFYCGSEWFHLNPLLKEDHLYDTWDYYKNIFFFWVTGDPYRRKIKDLSSERYVSKSQITKHMEPKRKKKKRKREHECSYIMEGASLDDCFVADGELGLGKL